MTDPTEPLDEILNLVEAVALARVMALKASNRGDADAVLRHVDQAQAVRLVIAVKVEDVRAAGVAEGRRQRDAEAAANVLASARQVAEEAGFAPVPEQVIVSYTQQVGAYEQGIYDAGIAEGRRQAAEEVVRQYAVLDSEEYRVALRKMIRTGEIRLPGSNSHGEVG